MLLSQVDEHRAELNGVTTLAAADLASYASTVIDESPPRAAAQLRTAATAVVNTYGDIAGTAGALFYETTRPQPGFTATPAKPSIGEKLSAELGWAFVPLFTPDLFPDGNRATLQRLDGVVQKFVSDTDRDTIIHASQHDPTSTGWRRYARVNACAFCAYLSSQEAPVEESTVWHNDCHCVTVPGWAASGFPGSQILDRFSDDAADARSWLQRRQQEVWDHTVYPHKRGFLKANPDLSLRTKNIARVMRELYGYAH